ncbi:DUF3556 domain-containing protein [Saccharopolyspora sp. NPDC002686]|uniref:DUF3556 domain-containing protein n=1 Tax=Saccharopolyspora sp. NPDC002686 TaxID=3154541 RepID=UPI003328D6C1
MAHVGGTLVEIATPLVLLLSTNRWLTSAGVVLMVLFHLFITSTFPAGGTAGVERPVRLRRRLPVPRLPGRGRLRAR